MNRADDLRPEPFLERVREGLTLDRETEREILEEIRSHLHEAAASGRSKGLDEATAWSEAVARFGPAETALELRRTHAGAGTSQALVAAGLPVVLALVLRWLLLDPNGTASGWIATRSTPAAWGTSILLFVASLRIFARWRQALAAWVVFWAMTVLSFVVPVHRW